MQKKVLFLHAGSEMYGADKVLLDLVVGLNRKDIDCHVILPSNGVLLNEMEKRGIRVSVINYPILRRKIFNLKGMIKYIIDYFKYSYQLMKYVKKERIDIVHVNTTAVLEGIYLKVIGRKKLVWHVHEIIVSPNIVYKLTSLLLNFADQVVTVSEATKNHIVESKMIDRSKIEVIYNGVNNEVYNPNNKVDYLYKEFCLPHDAIIIGMIGRINSWKGQLDFVDAVEPILKSNSKYYAVIVGGVFEGENHFFEALKSRINNSIVKKQFRVSDFRSDIANIHNLFDVFVLPRTNPDTLPTVVLEAMTAGKPVIGYKHGGIREMVSSSYKGLLANPCNIKNLSECRNRISIDEELRSV